MSRIRRVGYFLAALIVASPFVFNSGGCTVERRAKERAVADSVLKAKEKEKAKQDSISKAFSDSLEITARIHG